MLLISTHCTFKYYEANKKASANIFLTLPEPRWYTTRAPMVHYQSTTGTLPEHHWYTTRAPLVHHKSPDGTLPEPRWYTTRAPMVHQQSTDTMVHITRAQTVHQQSTEPPVHSLTQHTPIPALPIQAPCRERACSGAVIHSKGVRVTHQSVWWALLGRRSPRR